VGRDHTDTSPLSPVVPLALMLNIKGNTHAIGHVHKEGRCV
jgi:hypothetical protein